MAITNVGSAGVLTTASALGTTSTTTAYTATATAGRLGIITAVVKPNTATLPTSVTDAAGKVWYKIADATGGTGTTGADVGLSRIAKYLRIFDGTETGPVTVTATSSSHVTASMDVYASSLGGWTTPISVTASDAAHGSNCSAASGAWAWSLAVNDWVHAGYGSDTDALTVTSAHNIAQTSTTFGTRTARSRLNNSSGNQGGVHTWDASVTAGGFATATTLGFTWASSSCGPFAATRLREQAPTTMPSPTTVVDNFNDNSIDLTKWDRWGGAQITETGSQLVLTTTTTAGGYYGINRLTQVDFAGAYAGARLVNAGNQALTSFGCYPFQITFSTGNEAYWYISNNTLYAYTNIGGSFTQRASMPYVQGMHVYFAIGIIGGSITWAWSTNGTSWTIEATLANPFGVTLGYPTFMVGTDAVEGSTTSMTVDDYTTWGISSGTSHTAAASLPVTTTLSTAGTRTALVAGASLTATTAVATASTVADLGTTSLPIAASTSTAAGLSLTAAASLATVTTATPDASRTVIGSGTLPVTVTITSTAARTATAAAGLAVPTVVTTAGTGARPTTATLAIVAGLTTAATADHPAGAALASTATIAADATRAAPGDATLATTTTVLAAATVTDVGDVTLPTVTDMTAAGTASSASTSVATLAAATGITAGVLREASAPATLAVITTATASAAASRPAGATIAVVVALATAATRVGATTSSLAAATTMSTAVLTALNVGAGLAATTTVSTAVAGAGPAAAALDVLAVVAAATVASRSTATALTVAVAFAPAGAGTRPGAAALGLATLLAAGSATPAASSVAVAAAITATATRAAPVSAELTVTAVLVAASASTGRPSAALVVAVAALAGRTSMQAVGSALVALTVLGATASTLTGVVAFATADSTTVVSTPDLGGTRHSTGDHSSAAVAGHRYAAHAWSALE